MAYIKAIIEVHIRHLILRSKIMPCSIAGHYKRTKEIIIIALICGACQV
jgi:hypothetical protein